MFENIALSFQGIWNHKTRSFLTMLGIIIGIAAIITIVSTIKGTNDQIKENLIGAGSNVINVTLARTDGDYYDPSYTSIAEGVTPASEETREEILALEGVKDVSFFLTRDWLDAAYYGNTAFNGSIRGVDSHYFKVNSYRLNAGRTFVAEDYSLHRKVVIIDTRVVSGLFEGQDPIGETIEINGEPFTVIGVTEKVSKTSLTINSFEDYWTYMDTSNGTLFIPIDTWPILYKYDEPRYAAVQASSTDEMTKVGNDAAEVMTASLITDSTYTYEADDLLEQASELQALSNSTNQQLLWIAGISLLVGGIGVMNIMLVSVTERTREIGLKKAIGAKRRRILLQFLTEAGVLTSLGGLFGVACGIGLAKLLSGVIGTPASISVPACVIAVAFSMFIGILFGLIPAVKASKLNPIDALRRE